MKSLALACTILAFAAVWLHMAGVAAEATEVYYTNRRVTELLTAPRSKEAPVGQLGFNEKLKLVERDGPWLKVSAGSGPKAVTGWVYEGNVSAKRPPNNPNLEFLPSSAGETTTSVAARPLNETAKKHAESKGKTSAASDIEWLEQRSDQVTPARVVEHLTAQKRGEYQ